MRQFPPVESGVNRNCTDCVRSGRTPPSMRYWSLGAQVLPAEKVALSDRPSVRAEAAEERAHAAVVDNLHPEL